MNTLISALDQQPNWKQREEALHYRFYQLLTEEQKELNKKSPTTKVLSLGRLEWKLAAAIALLIIGMGFGNLWQRNLKQQAELQQLQEEMLTTQKMLVLAMLEKKIS